MQQAVGSGANLSFALSDDGRKLLARFSPGGMGLSTDKAGLRRLLDEEGWGRYSIYEPFLDEVARKCQSGLPFEQVIGEARDGSFEVKLDNSKMAAYLTLVPPEGGKAVEKAEVFRRLEEMGIVAGLNLEAIDRALALGEASLVPIAAGRQPEHGVDGWLESLIPIVRERRPRIDENGIAHYRDMGEIVVVRAGESVMRRNPPTPGVAGETVLGQPIPAKPGKEVAFASKLSGVEFDPADPNVLRAALTGQPVRVKNGINIEPTYTVPKVDITTGNIAFEGTVKVLGDVQAGMEIQATGDIYIDGTVEAASLDAGGDIVVKGGVIGRMDARDRDSAEARSHVCCDGSFSARFVQNARVDAGDGIYVEEMVMQSDLSAVNQIIVGKQGAAKGHIIGGSAQATLLIQAHVLGSPSHTRTQVSAGISPREHDLLKRLAREREAWENRLADVEKLLAFARENPGRIAADVLARADYTRRDAQTRIELLREEQEQVSLQIELAKDAKVAVIKTVFGGIEVEFGGKFHWTTDKREGGVFRLDEGELIFDALPRQLSVARGGAH